MSLLVKWAKYIIEDVDVTNLHRNVTSHIRDNFRVAWKNGSYSETGFGSLSPQHVSVSGGLRTVLAGTYDDDATCIRFFAQALVRPIVINESHTERKYPGQDPIGRGIRFGGSPDRPWTLLSAW